MPGRDERGYALVAAITGAAALAYIAFQVLAADRGAIVAVAGRVEQARLSAAADAGIALAIHALAQDDPTVRWSIDGRTRRLDFDGVDLAVVVEDERGKAPLAGLNDTQSRALFEGAGASGDRLDALVDEFRDWQAQDTLISDGASGPVRHGQFRTVGELMALKDMDAALYERIAPAVTVFFEESGPFEPRNASPLAIRAMGAMAGEGGEGLSGENLFTEERPVEEIAADDHLVGRTLTVRVAARDRFGGVTHRMAIVELTGAKAQPYWIRYVE